MPLDFQQLKQAALKHVDVDAPELGGTVRLGFIDAKQGMGLSQGLAGTNSQNADAMSEVFVEVLALSIRDEHGAAMCDSPEGRELIRKLPIGALVRLGQAAFELNGLSAEEAKKNN